MGRIGSHEEMVPLTPKTQLSRMLGPVLLVYEPTAACWEVLYLFFSIYLKMAMLIICYLFGFFFPAVRPCWGQSPAINMWSRSTTDTVQRASPSMAACTVCAAGPSSLPGNIHIQLILTWSLELFEMSYLGKERGTSLPELCSVETFELLWEALSAQGAWQWQEFPPWPELLRSCPKERHRAHLLAWMGRVCLHHNPCVLLGRPFKALGICCCSIFVLITGVKGNQGLVFCCFFFLIGEIQIKLNKWTLDVGYILQSLKKGKRPQRGWTWFLGTLYMT